MQNGTNTQPIPPNLHELLGEPQRTFDGEPHWKLTLVAAAIGCHGSCVSNWINWGQLPEARYDAGQWWIPLRTVNYLRMHGPAARDKFPRLKGRHFVRNYAQGNRPPVKPL